MKLQIKTVAMVALSLAFLSPLSANWWNGYNMNDSNQTYGAVQGNTQGSSNASGNGSGSGYYRGTGEGWGFAREGSKGNVDLALNFKGKARTNMNTAGNIAGNTHGYGNVVENSAGSWSGQGKPSGGFQGNGYGQGNTYTYGNPSQSSRYQGYGSNTSWGNARTSRLAPTPYSVQQNYRVKPSYQNNSQASYEETRQQNLQRFRRIQQVQMEALQKQNEAYLKQLVEQQRMQMETFQQNFR